MESVACSSTSGNGEVIKSEAFLCREERVQEEVSPMLGGQRFHVKAASKFLGRYRWSAPMDNLSYYAFFRYRL